MAPHRARRDSHQRTKSPGKRVIAPKELLTSTALGAPLRELQHLLGHRSQQTTEICIKSLVPETVRPIERPMIAVSS